MASGTKKNANRRSTRKNTKKRSTNKSFAKRKAKAKNQKKPNVSNVVALSPKVKTGTKVASAINELNNKSA